MKKGWGVKISGWGACLPGNAISNKELQQQFQLINFNADKHAKVTGILYRHLGDQHTTTSIIAAKAGEQALSKAGIKSSELSRIILGTQTPDFLNTAASCHVQYLLKATCPVGDTNASCASFMYALDYALRLVATGEDKILLIGADMKSRNVRRGDELFLPLFSDGAGALVLEPCNDNLGFIGIKLWADGSGYKDIIVPAGGSALPASEETINKNLHGTVMQISGKKMADTLAQNMASVAAELCNETGIAMSEIELFIPHQANLHIMRKAASLLNIPSEKMVISIDKIGNCISGTIPITLHQAFESGKMKKGAIVLLSAAGAGYTAGAALYRCT